MTSPEDERSADTSQRERRSSEVFRDVVPPSRSTDDEKCPDDEGFQNSPTIQIRHARGPNRSIEVRLPRKLENFCRPSLGSRTNLSNALTSFDQFPGPYTTTTPLDQKPTRSDLVLWTRHRMLDPILLPLRDTTSTPHLYACLSVTSCCISFR